MGKKGEAKRLLARLIEGLKPTYDLIYVDYRDELSEKQVTALVENDWEGLIDGGSPDWEYESRNAGTQYVIEDITTEDEREALEDQGLLDDLRTEIEQREDGSWLRTLIRQTPDPLLRVLLRDEDDSFSYKEVTVEQLLEACRLPATEKNREAAASCIAESSPEFSVCLVSALVTIDLVRLYDLPDDVQEVWISNPDIWMGNPFAGNGYVESFEGWIKVKREDLKTDKAGFGYGWQDVVGQTWQTKGSDLFPAPAEGEYMQCGAHVRTDTPPWERCHLFVEANDAYLDSPGLAPWVHLHRGDETDEALDANHEAAPSMDVHSLDHWREHGPDAMKARFTS